MAKAKEPTKKYLQAPLGYVIKGPVEMEDEEALREFALGFSDDPKFVKGIRKENLKGLQQFFLDNGFKFGKEHTGISDV